MIRGIHGAVDVCLPVTLVAELIGHLDALNVMRIAIGSELAKNCRPGALWPCVADGTGADGLEPLIMLMADYAILKSGILLMANFCLSVFVVTCCRMTSLTYPLGITVAADGGRVISEGVGKCSGLEIHRAV